MSMQQAHLVIDGPHPCSAEEVLSRFPDQQGIALVYTPARAVFARLKNGQLMDAKGEDVNPGDAFELRLFNETMELRWRRRGTSGEYVLLREEQHDEPCCWRRETRYLLWGQRDEESEEAPEGWSILTTAQIGKLKVPKALTTRHARLRAVEYFREAEDGNVVFLAERLTGIEDYEPKRAENSDG